MERPGVSGTSNLITWSILGYLCSHPYAKDTVAGVARWWLGAEGLEATRAEVKTALDQLVAAGWVTVFRSPVSQPIYGLDPIRLGDIQRLGEKPTSSKT